MTPEQFVYWLQGYFELTEEADPTNTYCMTPEQLKVVREHLSKVFNRPQPKGLKSYNQPIIDNMGRNSGHPDFMKNQFVTFSEVSPSC